MKIKNLPDYIKSNLCNRFVDFESTSFLCQPYSLGDAVLDFSLILEFRKKNPGIKVTYITSEYIGRTKWLFEKVMDQWIFLPHNQLYELSNYAVNDFAVAGPGVLSSMSPSDYAKPLPENNLLRYIIKELGEFPFKKLILGLDIECKPNFPFDLKDVVQKNRLKTKKPTIYFNPRAQSVFALPSVVVEQTCHFLDDLGFTVYLDVNQDRFDLPKSIVQLSCTLQQAIETACSVDIVMTYRSGLTDLLATVVQQLVVLYPCRSYTKYNFDYRSYNTVHLGLRQQEESVYDFWGGGFPSSVDCVHAHVAMRLAFFQDWLEERKAINRRTVSNDMNSIKSPLKN